MKIYVYFSPRFAELIVACAACNQPLIRTANNAEPFEIEGITAHQCEE